jgi:hypothetical protein
LELSELHPAIAPAITIVPKTAAIPSILPVPRMEFSPPKSAAACPRKSKLCAPYYQAGRFYKPDSTNKCGPQQVLFFHVPA